MRVEFKGLHGPIFVDPEIVRRVEQISGGLVVLGLSSGAPLCVIGDAAAINAALSVGLASRASPTTSAPTLCSARMPAEPAPSSVTAYNPWPHAGWPKPPDREEDDWGLRTSEGKRLVWVMKWNGGSMAEVGEPSDAELRRYVGEVMAGGPGFASAKKEKA